MEIKIAKHYGMCSGVRRALELVETTLATLKKDETLFIFHEIVHNSFVIEELKKRRVRFVETLAEVPDRATLIFSAHGVGAAIEEEAHQKQCRIIDATCPLVKKNHRQVAELSRENTTIILIGQKTHPEIEGTRSRIHSRCLQIETLNDVENLPPSLPPPIACISQTTLAVEDVQQIFTALKQHYQSIQNRGGICFATTERQSALHELAEQSDLILVVGSPNSSNSRQLRQLAANHNIPAFLVNHPDELPPILAQYPHIHTIGLSAGASTPQSQINTILNQLDSNKTRKGLPLQPPPEV